MQAQVSSASPIVFVACVFQHSIMQLFTFVPLRRPEVLQNIHYQCADGTTPAAWLPVLFFY
jgi:hypothetical protein